LKGATATIPDLKLYANADSSGLVVIQNIPNGKFEVEISFTGFGKSEKVYAFPIQHTNDTLTIILGQESGELAEVTVQTTRTNQDIRDIPTRIEALPLEELDEKSTMRPGDIKMLLGETTGIHVQQSSAVSGNASFRIQGLDSRYTQLLQDGMPLYAGFSGNLSLLQFSFNIIWRRCHRRLGEPDKQDAFKSTGTYLPVERDKCQRNRCKRLLQPKMETYRHDPVRVVQPYRCL
jgi:iron complex outermembrane receptor protein